MNDGRKEDVDLPSFSLSKIAKSTSNFSVTNKLGEGGFGSVYKVTKVPNPVINSLSCFYLLLQIFIIIFSIFYFSTYMLECTVINILY